MEMTWAQYAHREHMSDDERSSMFRQVREVLRRDGIKLVAADTLPPAVWRQAVRAAHRWQEIVDGTFEMWD